MKVSRYFAQIRRVHFRMACDRSLASRTQWALENGMWVNGALRGDVCGAAGLFAVALPALVCEIVALLGRRMARAIWKVAR